MKTLESMRPAGLYSDVIRQRALDGEAFNKNYASGFVDVACPACGGDGEETFVKHGFHHRVCREDGTLFCSPRPTHDQLTRYYQTFTAPRLWTRLLLEADQSRKRLQYRPRVSHTVDILRGAGVPSGGLAVDLGAGSGAFSTCLLQSGYFARVLAVDLSDDCVAACREAGLESRLGSVDDLPADFADFICMNDLIEHVFDPFEFLSHCFRVLRPGGAISIATPNGQGFDFRILKERTGNITPPEHLTYFNPDSMDKTLRRVGFQPLAIETPGLLDVQIICKEMANGLDLAERNEYLAFLLGRDEATRQSLQRFLVENRLSSHLLAIARKPL